MSTVAANNRSNSFVDGSVLYIKPTLTRDLIGEQNVQSGYTVSSLLHTATCLHMLLLLLLVLESPQLTSFSHFRLSYVGCVDGHVGLLSRRSVYGQRLLRL